MSFLESVIDKTRRLERLLEEKYHADGKGLHEKATSVESRLDSNLVKQIRFIASVRNKLMHEDGYRFDRDESEFLRKCDDVIAQLTGNHTNARTYAPTVASKPAHLRTPPVPVPRRIARSSSQGFSSPATRLSYSTDSRLSRPKVTTLSFIRVRRAHVVALVLFLFGISIAIYLGGGFQSLKRQSTDEKHQSAVIGTMREVNALNLNMRAGPGANYPVVATFKRHDRIVTYGETQNVGGDLWTQVSTPEGQTRGWMIRKFLSP